MSRFVKKNILNFFQQFVAIKNQSLGFVAIYRSYHSSDINVKNNKITGQKYARQFAQYIYPKILYINNQI